MTQNIELVTFTGVDSRTSRDEMGELSLKYPKAEFGVLVGSHTGEDDHMIFPPLNIVGRMQFEVVMSDYRMKTAIHLCGKYSRMVMDPNQHEELFELCVGFGRVQVNLHADSFMEPERIGVISDAVTRFAEEVPCEKVILQHRGAWEDVPILHKKVEYLWDVSEGGGRASFDLWPPPHPHFNRLGYAGGIGPQTIGKAIEFAAKYPESRLWFDMEGRIRTNGWFDIVKVEQVCEAVFRSEGENDAPGRSGI